MYLYKIRIYSFFIYDKNYIYSLLVFDIKMKINIKFLE